MLIAFRADASLQIGSGHIMRCLALADTLRDHGAKCHFVCRELPGHLGGRIVESGHGLTLCRDSSRAEAIDELAPVHAGWLDCSWDADAKQSAAALSDKVVDWLIVDHYALDEQWERSLRSCCSKVMVIDDLADRRHDCDLLLDQNPGRDPSDYDRLVPEFCRRLIGPQFALLRPQFAQWREKSLRRRSSYGLHRILVSMGGVDMPDATTAVLRALKAQPLPIGTNLTVVMGQHAPWLDHVRGLAAAMPFSCDVQLNVNSMAQIMCENDLSIGAAGTTSLERACLGLPSIIVVLAENQRDGAIALGRIGAAAVIEGVASICDRLPSLLAECDAARLRALSMASRELTDGRGTSLVREELCA